MKTMKKFLFMLAGIGLLLSCTQSEPINDDTPLEDVIKAAEKEQDKKSATVSIPFKAEFRVWNESAAPSETCGELMPFQLVMTGEGTMAHLGKITTRMVFCADGQPVGPYGNGAGYFVAANDDTLHFALTSGVIMWNEGNNADVYPTRFNDSVAFTGGSGRFEGAEGYLMTNAFVHLPADENDVFFTDFNSTGTLILPKGKR